MNIKVWAIILILFFSAGARAEFMLDLSGSYLTEKTNSSDVKDDSTKLYYNVGAYIQFAKRWWAGWSYLGVNMTGTSNATGSSVPTSFQSADTGPAVKFFFGKNDLFNLTAGYNVLAKASYKNVVSNETEAWQGTSLLFGFGMMPEVKSGFRIGVSINYYYAMYSKKTVDGTETSESNTKSWMFPSLNISKQW